MIKLKKLNNRGLTAVEILVCFVLMVILVVSMYSTVISYKNKQNIESDRDKIISYKNLLTKEIQDDLIKKGLINAKMVEEISSSGQDTDKYYKVEFTFRDGTKKILEVTAQYARDFEFCSGDLTTEEEAACKYDKDDVLKISYGSAPGADDYTSYVLPDLGYGYNGNIYASEYGAQCSGNYDEDGNELDETDKQGCKVYDFRISNIIVETDEIFNFYVGFYHPDFETRYGIDIVYPIDLTIEKSALELGPICGEQTPTRTTWDNTGELTLSVACVAREGGSPCASPSFTQSFTEDSKINYITIVTEDGNETKCPVLTYLDKTPPDTPTIVSTEGFAEGTWKKSNFTLTVTSTDKHSGIKHYQYCYPGADNACTESEWVTYDESVRDSIVAGEFSYVTTPFSAERSEEVAIRAVDRANNVSTPGYYQINIDKTGPVISNVNFDTSSRKLTATITDNVSLVSEYTLTTSAATPSTYTNITDTATYSLSYDVADDFSGTYYIWAKDAVGNVGDYESINISRATVNLIGSFSCANTSAGSAPYEMTYTGDCTVIDDGNGNWRVKFLTNGSESTGSKMITYNGYDILVGILKFNADLDIDAFLVGGGGGGGGANDVNGGNGGGGGYTLTSAVSITSGAEYEIFIGYGGYAGVGDWDGYVGGDGTPTYAFGLTAQGGQGGGIGAQTNGGIGGAGGSGGGAGGLCWYSGGAGGSDGSNGSACWFSSGEDNGDYSSETAATCNTKYGIGQGTTTCEFGESGCDDSLKYSGGGGGGASRCRSDLDTGQGGSSHWWGLGLGGISGGGVGGGLISIGATSGTFIQPYAGEDNTGGGGGGGYAIYSSGGNGAAGGSGVVVIRNKR